MEHPREQATRRGSRRTARAALAAATVVGVAGTVALSPAPAHAYGNEWPMTTKVSTSDCASQGDRVARKVTGGCYLTDQADSTHFRWDEGGTALKFEVYTGTTLRGKVEFHPRGEQLWIYDTSNDGDTIYVDVKTEEDEKAYRPPGTSKKLDYEVVDMSLREGSYVSITVWDGYTEWGGWDKIASARGNA